MTNEKLLIVFFVLAGVVGISVAAIGEYILISGLPSGRYPVLIFGLPILAGGVAAAAIIALPFVPSVVSKSIAMIGSIFAPLLRGWRPLRKLISGKTLDWHERNELRSFVAVLLGIMTAVAGEYYVLVAYQEPMLMLAAPLAVGFAVMLASYMMLESVI